jgi:hypothetical protein
MNENQSNTDEKKSLESNPIATPQNKDDILTVPAFRDASGIGRNRSIEILEFFDSRRITIRVGNERRMLSSADKAFAQLLKAHNKYQVTS